MTASVDRRAERSARSLFGPKNLFAACILILLACCMARPLRDPDVWFHIVSGRWILSHHQVPTQDYWNMFGAGRPWRAYSWLSEILFARVERDVGLRGLVLLEIFTGFLFVASAARCYVSLSRSYIVGLLLTVLTALGCYWHISLRPQAFTWIL